jgi:hypothetical protein
LTRDPPTVSIAPIHADEVTMKANARKQRRGFDSYPCIHKLSASERGVDAASLSLLSQPSLNSNLVGSFTPKRPEGRAPTNRQILDAPDSYLLRQLHLRFAICDLRFEAAAQAASPDDQIVNRKSQFVNPGKGGGRHVARTGP